MRRALILVLGPLGLTDSPSGEREPLIDGLVELYRTDPDAGIHGAAEWTLRRWDQGDRLKSVDTDLKSLQDRGGRRWYLTKQGQTFAVIDGPVAFRMGSPRPTRSDRGSEAPLQITIPRQFAIATTEVTFGQFQRFLKDHDNTQEGQSYLKKYTPLAGRTVGLLRLVRRRRLLQLAERTGEHSRRRVVLPYSMTPGPRKG